MVRACRALQELQTGNAERFERLQQVAKEQAVGSGESDLRRLRRQFSSLKNTFLHYDVKQTFIDGAHGSAHIQSSESTRVTA